MKIGACWQFGEQIVLLMIDRRSGAGANDMAPGCGLAVAALRNNETMTSPDGVRVVNWNVLGLKQMSCTDVTLSGRKATVLLPEARGLANGCRTVNGILTYISPARAREKWKRCFLRRVNVRVRVKQAMMLSLR